jgi:hypothetical protein
MHDFNRRDFLRGSTIASRFNVRSVSARRWCTGANLAVVARLGRQARAASPADGERQPRSGEGWPALTSASVVTAAPGDTDRSRKSRESNGSVFFWKSRTGHLRSRTSGAGDKLRPVA